MEIKEPFLLKNLYSAAVISEIARQIHAVFPGFEVDLFTRSVLDAEWADRALKQRMRHISHCLRAALPPDYPRALSILTESVEHLLGEKGEQMNFIWCVFPDFVEAYGVAYPDESIPALRTMTKLGSAEFAVRPFLLQYPERMYKQMLTWSEDENPWVRRLSTEGFRPRLPWGLGIPALKNDPSPILPVLENLKNDPSETVRRSVANNLNDISKDHPALALSIAQSWHGYSELTDRMVKHALRGLLKKGDPVALALFGYEERPETVLLHSLVCDADVRIGEALKFSFTVHNQSTEAQNLRLEYAIEFLTGSGKKSRKVFKISELNLQAGQMQTFVRRQRFQDFTTRKHYPGEHLLEILANGKPGLSCTFGVLE